MDSIGHSEFPVWKENRDGMQELGEAELITPLVKEILQKVLGSSELSSDWSVREEIIWIKSRRDAVESLNKMETGVMVSFDQTPFSQILLLVKKGSNLEYKDRFDRLSNLRLSDKKKI